MNEDIGVMVRSRLSSFGAKSSILTVFPSFAFVLPPLATFPHATAARKTARYVPSTLLTPFSFSLPSARHLPARYRGLEDGSLRFLLFPSFPSLLSLISLLLSLYSSLLFSSLFSFFLLFSPFSYRGKYD